MNVAEVRDQLPLLARNIYLDSAGAGALPDFSARSHARKLQEGGLVVAPRVNTLRVSPHFFNTEQEIDVLLDRMKNS